MTAINRVLLVGRLTKAPELRHTQGGTAVADLSLAVNSREKKGDEWVERADFFDITVWGNTAEACDQYLGKGAQVAIDGVLRHERWETDNGEKRSKVKVVVGKYGNVQFLDTRDRDEDRPGDYQHDQGGAPPDDDIPF